MACEFSAEPSIDGFPLHYPYLAEPRVAEPCPDNVNDGERTHNSDIYTAAAHDTYERGALKIHDDDSADEAVAGRSSRT